MYKAFFGLKASPFNVNPDPRFLFRTKFTNEALACLAYGIQNRKGFMLLTGEVGTGKTTILNKLMEWMRTERVRSAFVFNPRLEVNEFLEYILNDLGIPCPTRDKGQMLMRLNQWLLERYRSREAAVLIVDEAQNLSSEMLEEIRLLTNLETSTEKLLQIVLSGQPELEAKLKTAELRQLRQRITLRCHTYPLSDEQTSSYIERRLRVAGASGTEIFSPAAIETISRCSGGIPRIVNLLCEHSLINAFVEQKVPITAEIVEEVAREFQLDAVPSATSGGDNGNGDNAGLIDAIRLISAIRERKGLQEHAAVAAEDKNK